MTYIIAEPCIDIKDRSCVDVCPVDCIHEAGRILVIDPEECIDCGACEPECPVEAIFPEDALPEKWEPFVKINYAYAEGMDGRRPARRRVRDRAQRPERAARSRVRTDRRPAGESGSRIYGRRPARALCPLRARCARPATERERFEEHLAECERCRAELAGLRDAAASLAFAVEGPAPPAALRGADPRGRAGASRRTSSRSGRAGRSSRVAAASLAAAAAAAAVGLGVWAASLHHSLVARAGCGERARRSVRAPCRRAAVRRAQLVVAPSGQAVLAVRSARAAERARRTRHGSRTRRFIARVVRRQHDDAAGARSARCARDGDARDVPAESTHRRRSRCSSRKRDVVASAGASRRGSFSFPATCGEVCCPRCTLETQRGRESCTRNATQEVTT